MRGNGFKCNFSVLFAFLCAASLLINSVNATQELEKKSICKSKKIRKQKKTKILIIKKYKPKIALDKDFYYDDDDIDMDETIDDFKYDWPK